MQEPFLGKGKVREVSSFQRVSLERSSMYISRERGLEACFDFDSKLSGFAGVLSYGDYLFLLTALISRCYIIQCMYIQPLLYCIRDKEAV